MDVMNKMVANDYKGRLIFGILAVVIGIIALVYPGGTLKVIIILLGIFALLNGLSILFNAFSQKSKDTHDLLVGILYVVLGLIMIIASFAFLDVLMYILAAFLIIFGLFQLYEMWPIAKDSLKGEKLYNLVIAIIAIVLGIVIIVYPGLAANIVMMIIGAFLIIIGLINLLGAYQMKKSN
ncbi:HdeD family acid-resistance protein [Candidatus Methanomassiliicoccus intestinalis]|jgi:hypothetical protein|uniref:Acid-resistance membrane protein n=2 Tax=Candidatus Methanomassiliicoccus intestinalis TaxID=1406512 RepID=R9T5L1_METII|nr:DUF308 domain-containing protein [Candidatus Methanomassiliicoccus intestinalis]AGN26237.1 hypothetical protein MMINT_08780 [Candidatus Methanomassiliicoccus intestinalis Issoire-Mx1]TQS82345.1 MAG: hypothetical protein A3206_01405 [Candidatus Methanomassiliicoccus intestinalis]TQS84688.1 MAG: hypothetical protein A3207_01240 [Candidatus Methanomassiliicoccus intestinalis]